MIRYLLRSLLLFLGWLAVSAPAPALAQHGLNISLTTSGYRFQAPGTTPAPSVVRKGKSVKVDASVDSFAASVVLINMSGADLPVSFPNPLAAARHWTFSVFDSTGTRVWISETDDGATPVATPVVLKSRSSWRRTVRVPLQPNGTPLAAGRYTLEASLAGDPPLGASAAFEIAGTGLPPGTGIQGQVLQSPILAVTATNGLSALDPGAGGTIATIGLGVKATVVVNEIRRPNVTYDHDPFSWTGVTDDTGHYQVSTPAGKFRVGAYRYAPPVTTTGTVVSSAVSSIGAGANSGVVDTRLVIIGPVAIPETVTVTAGQITLHNIYLPGPIFPPPVGLPTDTGVTGTVTQAAEDGGSAPLAGATVRLERSFSGPIVYSPALIRPFPMPQTTTTDANGSFTFDAYAGSYRLTVYRDVVAGQFDATTSMPVAFASVYITAGKFTQVTLQAPPPVSSAAVPVASITSLKIETSQTATVGSVPMNFLVATGTVTTTGWTQAALRPRPSASSLVLEFDLVAVPPGADVAVGQVISPISASISAPGSEVSVIRVYSASNSQTLSFALPLLGATVLAK